MAVDIHKSRVLAFERLQAVIADQYATDVAAEADSGLYLPAPDAEAFYIVDGENRPREYRVNHHVAVFAYTVGARSFISQSTGGGLTFARDSQLPVRIEVHAKFAPQDAHTEVGRELPQEMLELWRAERYLGAIVNTITEHLRNRASGIYNLELTQDSTLLSDGWAIARTQWNLRQEVLTKTPDYDTV